MVSRHDRTHTASTAPPAARAPTVGDAAVDGLLAGLGAGAAMLLALAAFSLLRGQSFAGLLTAGAGPKVLPGSPVLNALLAQATLSALGGLLWSVLAWLVAPHLRARLWMAILFGALFTFALRLVLGQNSAWPAVPVLLWPAAHLVYGLTLGLISRSQAAEYRRSRP